MNSSSFLVMACLLLSVSIAVFAAYPPVEGSAAINQKPSPSVEHGKHVEEHGKHVEEHGKHVEEHGKLDEHGEHSEHGDNCTHDERDNEWTEEPREQFMDGQQHQTKEPPRGQVMGDGQEHKRKIRSAGHGKHDKSGSGGKNTGKPDHQKKDTGKVESGKHKHGEHKHGGGHVGSSGGVSSNQ